MEIYNSIEELAEAYTNKLNEMYGTDTDKGDWTVDAVKNIFVEIVMPHKMFHCYGVELPKWTHAIANFGYVKTEAPAINPKH